MAGGYSAGMYETPLTGLVLSGGGARAAYQVGVLRAIARLRRETLGPRSRLRSPFGIIVGTYSSLFVAAPFLLLTGVKRDWSKVKDTAPAKA